MTFQQIIDRNSFYVIHQKKGSKQLYTINKQRIPEVVKQFIQKNLGSNKSIVDCKSKTKSNYLRSQIQMCFQKIAKATKEQQYKQFLTGLRLNSLKGLALLNQNDLNNILQTEETEKVQIIQQNGKEQREDILQQLGDQRKPNIRIVIKSKVQN